MKEKNKHRVNGAMVPLIEGKKKERKNIVYHFFFLPASKAFLSPETELPRFSLFFFRGVKFLFLLVGVICVYFLHFQREFFFLSGGELARMYNVWYFIAAHRLIPP